MVTQEATKTSKNSLALRFLFWLDEQAYRTKRPTGLIWRFSTFLWKVRSKHRARKWRNNILK